MHFPTTMENLHQIISGHLTKNWPLHLHIKVQEGFYHRLIQDVLKFGHPPFRQRFLVCLHLLLLLLNGCKSFSVLLFQFCQLLFLLCPLSLLERVTFSLCLRLSVQDLFLCLLSLLLLSASFLDDFRALGHLLEIPLSLGFTFLNFLCILCFVIMQPCNNCINLVQFDHLMECCSKKPCVPNPVGVRACKISDLAVCEHAGQGY
mmetsp:Transcript_134711/g.233606  ORF Transcript_134711/g.233606 Transcript_134711/m.233606 type:complete len:204 (-) Transcript_134711:1493-2104(-)